MQINSAIGDKHDDNEYPPRFSWYYLCNLFLAILCGVSTLGMGYVTMKVQRKLWYTEKVIPSMLVFLILGLVSR